VVPSKGGVRSARLHYEPVFAPRSGRAAGGSQIASTGCCTRGDDPQGPAGRNRLPHERVAYFARIAASKIRARGSKLLSRRVVVVRHSRRDGNAAFPCGYRLVTPSASISMPPTSGLALRRAVLRSWPTATAGTMASTTAGTNGGSSAIGVGNRRACRRQVNICCGVSPCRRAISETTAWYQCLLDDPGLIVFGEPTTASRPRDHFQPARRHVRLKRMVKHRHKPTLQRDRETRLSHVPREGGSGTTLKPRLTQREEGRRQRLSLATHSIVPFVRRLILELEGVEPNELFGVSARRPERWL
jgi:hypothetical protein